MRERSGEQGRRRLKYGLNVSVALGAAVVLVVLLNWIAYDLVYGRFDLTRTGRYSLAPQTQQVLGELEGRHRMVTVLRGSSPAVQQLRDLVDEYGRASTLIRAEHINPDFDLGRQRQLEQELKDHLADELGPVREAIEDGLSVLGATHERTPTVIDHLHEAGESQIGVSQVNQWLDWMLDELGTWEANASQWLRGFEEALAQGLPDYAFIRSHLQQQLGQFEQVLEQSVQFCELAGDNPSVPGEAQEQFLRAGRLMEGMQQRVSEAVRELRLSGVPDRYDQAQQALQRGQSVVIMGPDRMRVLSAAEMFRLPGEGEDAGGRLEDDEAGRLHFLGEERVTGALIGMGLDPAPLVVFVSHPQQPALGERGAFRHVADRLRAAEFEVEEWSPAGRISQATGQMTTPEPPPQPDSGQRAVWVVMPQPEQDQAGPFGQQQQREGDPRRAVVSLLESRLDAGDAALLLFQTDTVGDGGGPIGGFVAEWGIRPMLDHVVLREQQIDERRVQATGRLFVADWPEASPVGRAVRGLTTAFFHANPVAIEDEAQVEVRPLVQVDAARIWAQPNLHEVDDIGALRYEAGAPLAGGPITIGAAASRGEDRGRMIVVSDPVWASDRVTMQERGGPGSGAVFPGNSELFMNSVYWLARLDNAIGAGARAQDIARIGAMSDARLRTYRLVLLAGLPAAAFAAGLGMWLLRRR